MTKFNINSQHETLSNRDLLNLESSLGVALPDDYRRFLLQHNGGRPYPKAFPLPNNPRDSHAFIERLFCVSTGNMYDIQKNADLMKGRLPAELLPIAEDPGGNLICIAVLGENRGKIYFWEHEEEFIDQAPSFENIYFVANNFDDLLNSLVELPK